MSGDLVYIFRQYGTRLSGQFSIISRFW